MDQVARVAAKLQADRAEAERLTVLIPWMWLPTAFTGPGPYIYFGRRLLERCRSDEAVAFVVAHEIAHHDLGHLDYFSGKLARLARLDLGKFAVLFFRSIQKRLYSVEYEIDADRHALRLCIRAGYNARRCLTFFDTMRSIMLDWGNDDGVYGLDDMSDRELSPSADFMTKTRIWFWVRRRGYLPLQDRQAELERTLLEWERSGAVSGNSDG